MGHLIPALRAHLDGYDGVLVAAAVVGAFVGLCVVGMLVSIVTRLERPSRQEVSR